jgi:prepilin signal peptidase PulO-like enzyme (type II secretory pathway)
VILQSILIILLGVLIADLINYLADVLPIEGKLTHPACKYCHHTYRLSSYLSYRKCPECGRNRTKRSWLILFVIPIVYLYFLVFPPTRLDYWMAILLIFYLCLVMVIDIEHYLILHITSLLGLIISFPIGITLHGLLPTIYGGLTGLGIMFALYLLGIGFISLVKKFKGKSYNDVALGFGDVSLSVLLGLVLGFPGIIGAILLAILLAGFYSLVYLITMLLYRRYKPLAAIPYAPFLALSALILLFR